MKLNDKIIYEKLYEGTSEQRWKQNNNRESKKSSKTMEKRRDRI